MLAWLNKVIITQTCETKRHFLYNCISALNTTELLFYVRPKVCCVGLKLYPNPTSSTALVLCLPSQPHNIVSLQGDSGIKGEKVRFVLLSFHASLYIYFSSQFAKNTVLACNPMSFETFHLLIAVMLVFL